VVLERCDRGPKAVFRQPGGDIEEVISAIPAAEYRLRSINEGDIEDLRVWKNLNRKSFFLKDEITPEQQSAWFVALSHRENDQMFVVEQHVAEDWEKIGCMGFRALDDEGCVDAYNIIRSQKIEPANFVFADPFRLMLAYAGSLYQLPIRCKVLTENPAVQWYERNGFAKIGEGDGYVLMELDKDLIKDLEFKKTNLT
jgi:ribosomal protein S18 acetylase RimI-like enzyme